MAAPASGSGDDLSLPIDVDLIKVLASDTRRDILRHLGERRRTLTELAEVLDLKKATVLEHLQKLVASGLIKRMDDGERLWVYYELSPRGKRIVRPERTRFYLMLAGSGVALLVVGALVAAAMLANVSPGSSPDSNADGRDDTAALADDLSVRTPVVLWRGFDDGVAIPIEGATPPGSELVVLQAGAPSLVVPVNDGKAVLVADQVDALASGRYPLALRSPAGDLSLRASLDVRDPPLALSPLAVPSNETTRIVLSLGEPGLPLPSNVAVRVEGAPVPLGELGRDRTFDVAPLGPGPLDVQVGRLLHVRVLSLAELRTNVAVDNGTLQFRVDNASDVAVTLGDAALGVTDADGALDVPIPSAGEHRVRLRALDGRHAEFPLAIAEGSAGIVAPRLQLTAFSSGQADRFAAQIEVMNLGVANETVTLIATLEGARIASTLVETPANGRAQAALAADVHFDAPVRIEAFAARGGTTVRFVELGSNFTTENGTAAGAAGEPQSTPPMAPSPAAPQGASQDEVGKRSEYLLDASTLGRPADATTTVSPTSRPTSDPAAGSYAEPVVPGPSIVLVLAIVALAALALRRQRR